MKDMTKMTSVELIDLITKSEEIASEAVNQLEITVGDRAGQTPEEEEALTRWEDNRGDYNMDQGDRIGSVLEGNYGLWEGEDDEFYKPPDMANWDDNSHYRYIEYTYTYLADNHSSACWMSKKVYDRETARKDIIIIKVTTKEEYNNNWWDVSRENVPEKYRHLDPKNRKEVK